MQNFNKCKKFQEINIGNFKKLKISKITKASKFRKLHKFQKFQKFTKFTKIQKFHTGYFSTIIRYAIAPFSSKQQITTIYMHL